MSMNACTRNSPGPKIRIKLPTFTPDKKLAFVENVCRILIEDRFGQWGFADEWAGGERDLFDVVADEIDVPDKPRFVPAADGAVDFSVSGLKGLRDDLRRTVATFSSKCLSSIRGPRLSIVPNPRGSPDLVLRAAAGLPVWPIAGKPGA